MRQIKSRLADEEFDVKEFTSLNNSIKKLYEDRDKAYERHKATRVDLAMYLKRAF
ncbi:hypothetical protein VB002_05565 [Campylobacter concisus]